jgi:hypothetical protein
VFRKLIDDAKSAAVSTLTKYAVRMSVAVPFLVAAGFGTAAVTVMLVERFGSLKAYGLMAAGFAAIGLVSTIAVAVKEKEDVAEDVAAEQNDTAEVATDAAAQAAVQLPLALLGMLFTTPMGPSAALGGAKALGRNWPMVLMLVLVGLLFWPLENKEGETESAADEDPDPAANELGRDAA